MLEKLDVPPLRLIAFNILTLTSPLWSTLKSALSGTKPPAQNLIELLDVPYPVIPACPFLNKMASFAVIVPFEITLPELSTLNVGSVGGCPFAPAVPPDQIRIVPDADIPPVLPKAIAPVVMSPPLISVIVLSYFEARTHLEPLYL